MTRVAIVGTGAISRRHIEACLAFPDRCRITALADTDTAKAEEKKAEFGLSARIHDDYRHLAEAADVDLVSVCLPPFLHAPVTIDLLDAEKHVLVEKPMASSLEECDRMIDAAGRSGRLLSVVAQNRFQDAAARVKRLVEADAIGTVRHAQVDSFWWRGDGYYDLWWRGTWEKEGGGCTMNHAVHHIDLLHWIMGMPERVISLMGNIGHTNAEVEDLSVSAFGYADGRLAQVTCSVVHHGEAQRLVFQGERGMIAIPWDVKVNRALPNGFPEDDADGRQRVERAFEALPELSHTGHTGQLADMLDAIEHGKPLTVDGTEGRRTVELISAIYQSAALGQPVRLPMSGTDPFYTKAGILANAPHFHEKTRSVESLGSDQITVSGETPTAKQRSRRENG